MVDAAQGVEAQTLANVYQSIEHDHEIVPVINKIDLPAAEPEKVRHEIEDIIGIDASEAVLASAKSGIGIAEVLEAIVAKIPPPKGDRAAPAQGPARRLPGTTPTSAWSSSSACSTAPSARACRSSSCRAAPST